MSFRCERCQVSFINTSCVCNPPNVLVSSADPLPSYLHLETSYTHNSVTDSKNIWIISGWYVMLFSQAGGLCFLPDSLPTNVNPSVSYAQLVSLLLLSHLLTLYVFIFLYSDLCFLLCSPCRSSVSSLNGS